MPVEKISDQSSNNLAARVLLGDLDRLKEDPTAGVTDINRFFVDKLDAMIRIKDFLSADEIRILEDIISRIRRVPNSSEGRATSEWKAVLADMRSFAIKLEDRTKLK